MTNDKSGVWTIGENSGANAMADENPVNDYGESHHGYVSKLLALAKGL